MDLDLIQKFRNDLAVVTKMSFHRFLTSGVYGNTSLRVPGQDMVLIKATGRCFGEVTAADFLLIDLEGNLVNVEGFENPKGMRPSKEVVFHCGIYKIRPEVGGIFHGHSPYATAYATKKGCLPLVTASCQAAFSKVDIIEYAPAGSLELANMVIDSFEDKSIIGCVLKAHGFVTVGKDIHNAFYLADLLEDNAKVACIMDAMN